MKKLPIALQLYSVRDMMEKDFEGTIKKVKEMGYDGVEFAGAFSKSYEEIKDICERIGIVAVSAHVPYVEITGKTEEVFDFYKKIGCEYIAIPYLTEEYRSTGDKVDEFYKEANRLCEAAEQKGITLMYHNHDFEFAKIGEKHSLDVIYEKVPKLQTELDTCWVKVGGEDPADYIMKYSRRAPVVHLKDYVGQKTENMYALIGLDDTNKTESTNKKFEFRPIGQGVQDIPGIIKAAEKAGSSWLVVEQDSTCCGKSSIECAKESIEYLRKIY